MNRESLATGGAFAASFLIGSCCIVPTLFLVFGVSVVRWEYSPLSNRSSRSSSWWDSSHSRMRGSESTADLLIRIVTANPVIRSRAIVAGFAGSFP